MEKLSSLLKSRTMPVKSENEYEHPRQEEPVNASIITPAGCTLEHKSYNAQGDKIGDFSYAGFHAGKYELPITENLTVAMELSPTGTNDDTELIQKAIDKVYADFKGNGIKVIKLKSGIYNINKNGIYLKSGILLSGEGQGPTGTILYAKDLCRYNVITVSGGAPTKLTKNVPITDKYVRAGTSKIHISSENASNFKVGDTVVIYHPSTEKWIDGVKMKDMINVLGDDNSWQPGQVDMHTERTITEINGTEISFDFSFFVPYDKEYSQSYIYKIDDSNRLKDIGIENLRILSNYNGDPTDEEHAVNGIWVTNAKNIFVRNISSKHLCNSLITCESNTKQVTICNCSYLEPVSKITGGRRYSFATSTSAQQILCTGCYSYDGRHDFEASLTVTGPIAFVDNISDSSNVASETHGTWSTGVLYDNLYHIPNSSKGLIALANRGIYGTKLSQGWSAAGSVVWNCLASAIIAHKPPLTYQNFVVGAWGVYDNQVSSYMKSKHISGFKKAYRCTSDYYGTDSEFLTEDGCPFVGNAYFENKSTPVEPRSLYKAQLAQRFTGNIKNARPNAPLLVCPRSEMVTDDSLVTISGTYQSGAQKVTIYIDDIDYTAILKEKENSFEYTLHLPKGVHKIYATQTIDGVESTKTADRFITIGNAGENSCFLQSMYPPKKTTMLINDVRQVYCAVLKTGN